MCNPSMVSVTHRSILNTLMDLKALIGDVYLCRQISVTTQHDLLDCTQGVCANRASAIDAFARQKTSGKI